MSVLAFLERLFSSAVVEFLCKYARFEGLCEFGVSHMPVDSLHGSCHIHHCDLKLSLLLLFKSCPPLEMFSDFPLMDKYCCRPSSPPVSRGPGVLVSCWDMGTALAPTHILCFRDTQPVFSWGIVSLHRALLVVSPLGLV